MCEVPVSWTVATFLSDGQARGGAARTEHDLARRRQQRSPTALSPVLHTQNLRRRRALVIEPWSVRDLRGPPSNLPISLSRPSTVLVARRAVPDLPRRASVPDTVPDESGGGLRRGWSGC